MRLLAYFVYVKDEQNLIDVNDGQTEVKTGQRYCFSYYSIQWFTVEIFWASQQKQTKLIYSSLSCSFCYNLYN